jgi:DNA repair photolyase
MEYKSAFKDIKHRVFNTWCLYTKRIDTYGNGCQHNCKYCYSKSLLEFRNKWNLSPMPSNLIQIHKSIKKLKKCELVRLGSMTDCFQPIELKHRITYETIKLLNYYKIHYLIITKSNIVTYPEYLAIYDKNLAHFQISISSTSDKQAQKYENCTITNERISSLELLHKYGFDVSLRLSPFIYQYVDFDKLNKIKCDKILIEFLKVNHWTIKNFDIDYSEYTYKFGGHLNLQLTKKIELVNKIYGFKQKTVGEYVNVHNDYFKENVNFNKNDCCNLKYTKNINGNSYQLKLF